MVNLIRNENMKIYRRPRTWIMVGLLIALVFTFSILEWYYDGVNERSNEWRTQAAKQIEMYENRLADDKVELNEQSKQFLLEQIAMNTYRLDHNIRPTSATMWDGINGGAEFVVMITLLTIIVAGEILAGEFSGGTIKLLLIRPASRFKILCSKYAVLIMFSLFLLIILFISSVLINGILYKFEHMNLPLLIMNDAGQISESSMIANLWKTYLLNGVSTILFVTLAFMISAAFRSSSMAIGFSLFALFAGTVVSELVQRYEWGKYLLFSNIDLTQHLNGHPYQEGMTMTFSITVLVVYYILFNLVAWTVFMRRDVAA